MLLYYPPLAVCHSSLICCVLAINQSPPYLDRNISNTSGPQSTGRFLSIPPAPPSSAPQSSPSNNSALIGGLVGGLVGGVALIAMILGVLLFQRRRWRAGSQADKEPSKFREIISTGEEFFPIGGSNPSGRPADRSSDTILTSEAGVGAPPLVGKTNAGHPPASNLVADLCLPRGIISSSAPDPQRSSAQGEPPATHAWVSLRSNDSELADSIVMKAYKRLAQNSSFHINHRSVVMLGLSRPSADGGSSMVSPFAFAMDLPDNAGGVAEGTRTHMGHGSCFPQTVLGAGSISTPADRGITRTSVALMGKVASLDVTPGVNFQLDWER